MTKHRRHSGGAERAAIWAAAVSGGLLFVLLVLAAWHFSEVQKSLGRQILIGNATYAQTDRLLQMVNQETGVRAYVATREAPFLDIFYRSLPRAKRDEQTIENADGDVPGMAARMDASKRAAHDVDAYLRREIALTRSNPASAVRRLGEGKVIFDRFRAADAAVSRAEWNELTAQRVHTQFLARAGFVSSILLCLSLIVFAGAFATLLYNARIYRLSAFRDSLTGVLNRRGALQAIEAFIGDANQEPFGVVFIDLDGFKKINDSYGHATGDAILQTVGERLKAEVRENDRVCRLGGDEFVCIIAPSAGFDRMRLIAERLRKTISRPYSIAGDDYAIGCSVGVSMFPKHGESADVLLARADRAMYRAKHAGGGIRIAAAEA